MANHNSFIQNTGLNENSSLSHLLDTISSDMEDESNIIEQSKYYDDTDFKDALQQDNSKISILSLNCQSIHSFIICLFREHSPYKILQNIQI